MSDSTAPIFVSAATSSDGAQVTLTYNEPLHATTASTTAFEVSVDGLTASVTQTSTSGADVRLGLAASILPGQNVSVSYTAPTNNAATSNSAVQDTTGNDAASLSVTPVTNDSSAVNNTALNFTSSAIAIGSGDSIPEGITTADFNNDRLADLAITDAKDSDPRARIYLGNGLGGFTPGGTQTVGSDPSSITANDFNHDGAVDVAVANLSDGSISVLSGDGSGNLLAGSTLAAGTPYTVMIGGIPMNTGNPRPRIIVSGDFNGDNKADLAWSNDYNNVLGIAVAGTIGIAINNGTATPYNSVTATGTIGNNPYGLITTDLNGDGKLDLIAANSPSLGNGSISTLLGNGDGTFQAAISTTVGTRPRYLATGDFNRDGKQDVAVTQTVTDNNLRILLGNGSGEFSSQSTLSMGVQASPRGVISSDFNADGFLDLAANSLAGDNVSIFLGNGAGNFDTRKVFAAGDAAFWMASADFDRNGLPDLAITNETSTASTVSVLLNRTTIPSASSSEDSQAPADNTPEGVVVQNIDRDGDGLREAVIDRNGAIIDGNRDGIADQEQALVTAVRLMSDGAINTDYGAVAVSGGVMLKDTHCLPPTDDGSFNVLMRNGGRAQTALPDGITNSFIGAVSFKLSGIDPGATTTATLHLPSGLGENPNIYIRFNYLTNQFEDYTDDQDQPLYALIDSNIDGQIDAIDLSLTDGDLRWDRDGIANGTIEGLGFAATDEHVLFRSATSDELTGINHVNMLNETQRIDTLTGGLDNDRSRLIQAFDRTSDRHARSDFRQHDYFDIGALDANFNLAGQQTFPLMNNFAFSGNAGELFTSQSVLAS